MVSSSTISNIYKYKTRVLIFHSQIPLRTRFIILFTHRPKVPQGNRAYQNRKRKLYNSICILPICIHLAEYFYEQLRKCIAKTMIQRIDNTNKIQVNESIGVKGINYWNTQVRMTTLMLRAVKIYVIHFKSTQIKNTSNMRRQIFNYICSIVCAYNFEWS